MNILIPIPAAGKRNLLLSVLFLGIIQAAFGEIIPSSRRIDWSSAGTTVPSASWPVFTNLMSAGAKGNGTADDSAVMLSMISLCPSGQVIYLPPGNYLFKTNFFISKSIAIRGAGPSQTSITACFNPAFYFTTPNSRFYGNQYVANLTGGYTKGSTNLTIDTSALNSYFTVGNGLLIDQVNDGTFVNAVGNEGLCTYCSRSNGLRCLNQFVVLTGVSGPNITIDTPLYWSYSNSLNPQVTWFPGPNLSNAGVEDLRINDYFATNSIGSYNSTIFFFYCTGCWARNLGLQFGHRDHIGLYNSYHCVVRDCYFFHS